MHVILQIKLHTKLISLSPSSSAAAAAVLQKSPAEEAALAFAESKMSYAVDLLREKGTTFAPELFFLQGESCKGALQCLLAPSAC